MAPLWNHDGDPVELLQISSNVSKFRQALKENPRFLQDKVKSYFKVNLNYINDVCLCFYCKAITAEGETVVTNS